MPEHVERKCSVAARMLFLALPALVGVLTSYGLPDSLPGYISRVVGGGCLVTLVCCLGCEALIVWLNHDGCYEPGSRAAVMTAINCGAKCWRYAVIAGIVAALILALTTYHQIQ